MIRRQFDLLVEGQSAEQVGDALIVGEVGVAEGMVSACAATAAASARNPVKARSRSAPSSHHHAISPKNRAKIRRGRLTENGRAGAAKRAEKCGFCA